MAHNPHYSKYRPQWYRARVPIFWWVHKWTYARFILRELTSVFVALYALVLLFHIRALAQGPEAYASFVVWLKTPGALVMHAITFVFVVFHSITWFNLAPKALVLHLGKRHVPDAAIAALNYVAWGVVSVAIAWVLLAV